MQATICPGILGCDGIVRGRIADIDLFGAFTLVEMNEHDTGDAVFYTPKPFGKDLWSVKEIRDKIVTNRQASKYVKPRRTVEQLREDYAIAEQLNVGQPEENWISPLDNE